MMTKKTLHCRLERNFFILLALAIVVLVSILYFIPLKIIISFLIGTGVMFVFIMVGLTDLQQIYKSGYHAE